MMNNDKISYNIYSTCIYHTPSLTSFLNVPLGTWVSVSLVSESLPHPLHWNTKDLKVTVSYIVQGGILNGHAYIWEGL